jgi:DNA-binding NtrC family response regulator
VLEDLCHVLIVSPNSLQCDRTENIIRQLELTFVRCASLLEARAKIQAQRFRLVLCGDELPDCNLRTAVSVLAAATGGVPVIVLSHLADWDAYMKALAAGAFDYIACPPDTNEVERIVRVALAHSSPPPRASHATA